MDGVCVGHGWRQQAGVLVADAGKSKRVLQLQSQVPATPLYALWSGC
jgi:hypothetical protein